MIKVQIKNKAGNVTHGGRFETQEEITEWVDKVKPTGAWGKPAGVYPQSVLTESELVDSVEVFAGEGESFIEPMFQIVDQFTIEQEDITAQVEQEQINQEALAYLASTDYLVIREMDSGVPCSQEVKTLRQQARERIVR